MPNQAQNPPNLAELERIESARLIDQYPALRAELRRLRSDEAHAAAVARELVTARAVFAERAALPERVLLPTVGTDEDALLVSLRGTELARETVDGRLVAYSLGGCVGFVDAETWRRIGGPVRSALAAAHRPAAGEPSGAIVVEPHGKQTDLIALLPPRAHAVAMSREDMALALARQVPLTPLTTAWFRSALDSHDEAAGGFCRVLRNRYGALGRSHELEPERPRFSAAE